MNQEPWIGAKLPENHRILLLGESHYDDDNYGEKVSFSTAGVVRHYFEERKRWARFFDRMAASFGYDREHAGDFYELVCFGNYVDVICGIGDHHAEHYIGLHARSYNNDWFQFINDHEIDVLVCFSKRVFHSLPARTEAEPYAWTSVGKVGSRNNYVDFCTYSPGVAHDNCDVILKKPLKVYGIRHPSARGGYHAGDVYAFLREEPPVQELCCRK